MIGDQLIFYRWYQETENLTHPRPPVLMTHSIWFMATYVLLGLFIMTSADSWVGRGLIIGIGTYLSAQLLMKRSNPRLFDQTFFPHHASSPTPAQRELVVTIIVGSTLLWTVIMSSLLLKLYW